MTASKGFTLIELLVMIAIVGALVGIGIPLSQRMIDKGHEVACIGNLRTMGVGLQLYLQDHQQKLPTLLIGREDKSQEVPVLETVLLPYVDNDPAIFACPADPDEFEKTGSSYHWNLTQNGKHVTELSFFGIDERPELIPLISDKESWHPGGTNLLYADASVSSELKFITER